jgi:hypothetical protein
MAFRRAATSLVLASGIESAKAGATSGARARTRHARSAILWQIANILCFFMALIIPSSPSSDQGNRLLTEGFAGLTRLGRMD